MSDSYVCSGATMRCSCGTSQARLTVLPIRVTYLTGQPMANISDHISFVNLGAFGRCRSLGFPATASATAANHGSLTPMPCMHNTPFPWKGGKNDYIVQGNPALLKSSTCQCMWGGTISIVDDGQTPTDPADMSRVPKQTFPKNQPIVLPKRKQDLIAQKYINKEISKDAFFAEQKIPKRDRDDYWRAVKKARRHKAVQYYNNCWKDNPDVSPEVNQKNKIRWIRSSANGIDYNHCVDEKTIPPPDEVYRYVLPGEDMGNYFFPAADPMPTPEQLGIHGEAAYPDGTVIKKVLTKFSVDNTGNDEMHTCLVSTAAPVKAPRDGNWTNKKEGNMAVTEGGAIQFFVSSADSLIH